MDLAFLSIAELARQIRSRDLSPVEVTAAALDRIDRLQPRLNAFITRLDETALASARAAEREIMAGSYRGPLHGVPISLKDIYWTRGVRTTAGSRILADFVPKDDATATMRLGAAGAVVVGKTNLHEFAFGVTSGNPHYGSVRNPWDVDRIAGGSSGGSAAEVAAGLSYGSLGTDTGGSIRIPASLCGVVGLKPTYGRVSRSGIIPLAWSLDHAGPIARTVGDVAILFRAVADDDRRAPDSTNPARPAVNDDPSSGVRGLRFGVPTDFFFEGADPEVGVAVRRAIDLLTDLGAICDDVALPHARDTRPVVSSLIAAEAAVYHLRWLQTRPEDYGRDVRDRLENGAIMLAVDYLQAQRVRALFQAELGQTLERFDVIVTPTTPIAATRIGESAVPIDDVVGEPRAALPKLTSAFNAAGLPAISLPCGFTSAGQPIGLQLVGRPFAEGTLLRAAHAYEQATEWHRRRPPA